MAENIAPTLVVFVDEENKYIHLCNYNNGRPAKNYATASYNSTEFNDSFFETFVKIVLLYQKKYPNISTENVTLILSDRFFVMDTLTVPNNKKTLEHSVDLAIGAIYKNKNEITFSKYLLSQNKQTAIFGITGIRNEILNRFKNICKKNNINIQTVTFVTNSIVNAAFSINSKLKSANFLLLDIKENISRFAFVNKGRTIGTYSLPFGRTILSNSNIVSEDQLFNHTPAQSLVLSSNEKAKSKHTAADEDIFKQSSITDNDDSLLSQDFDEFETHADTSAKKSSRKLPKFMLRETPKDQNGYIYENFRIFLKWTLELLANNSKITSLGEIDTVYVNMPKEFGFLFDMINAEANENKVKFVPLNNDASNSPSFLSALELFGGFQVEQYNKINNF